MPAKLKDIDISLISIVDKGANLKEFVIKTFGAKSPSFERQVSIAKVDEEKRIIYGIVYSPDEIDAHEDYSDAAEIEKAAHNFLRKSKTNAVDTQHNLTIAEGCTIVESAIIKGSHEYFPNEKDGSWYVAIKVDNDEIWKGIKDGTYTGLSMYGFAKKEIEDVAKQEDALYKRFINRLVKNFGADSELSEQDRLIKDFNARYARLDHMTIIDALSSANYDVIWNDTISLEDKASVMIENLEQAKAKLESIEIDVVKSIIAKAGKTISAANLKKIQSAYDALGDIIALAETATEKAEKFIKNKNSTTMENVSKTEHDKIVTEKDEELKKLKEENEKLKKSSKGSAQIADEPIDKGEDAGKKKIFKWLGGPTKPKQ